MISENHKKKSSLSISKTVSSAVRSMHPSTFCNSLKYQSYVMEYQIVIKVLTRTSQANSNAQMIVVIRQAVIVKTAPAWMVSAIVTMGTGVKAATCPMTMSANTDPAMYLLIVPIHWVATFARAEKVTRETVINVPILMSAKIPCSPPDACKMPSVATYPPTLSANVNPASRGMEKSSAETSMNV